MDRRARLLGLKLRALVRDHLSDQSVGEPVHVRARRSATAWRCGVDLARRAPDSSAWRAAGMGHSCRCTRVARDHRVGLRHPGPPRWRAHHADQHLARRRAHALAGGARAVPARTAVPAEHMTLRWIDRRRRRRSDRRGRCAGGEVRGLEVLPVVDDPVRVSRASRSASVPTTAEASADARWRHHRRVAPARRHHRRGTPPPWTPPRTLRSSGGERLLRWHLISEPSTIGAVTLEPVAPPVPRLNLKDPVPCVAAGRDDAGASVVAVCSVGVDLDLIPYAADAGWRWKPLAT